MNPDPGPGIPVDEHMRPLPLKDQGLHCRRCHADLAGKPVEIHQRRRVVRCACGYALHVMRRPQPAEARGRARMSKKERRRQRATVRATWKPQGGEA